ncbi:hypothetical protein FGB62_403g06 [Gracilaria domingensis]|nr:hypothetical protein FGB62_444g03 [Gracilaria domingensis]KAI0556791.1 hypothetical protein FGB62_403g06 [Gracilaria domingensis]
MCGISFRGTEKVVECSNAINATVTKFVKENFPQNTRSYHIRRIKQFKSALVSTSATKFTVETRKCFEDRGRLRSDARQKYCVAAEFERFEESDDEYGDSRLSQSSGDRRSKISVDVYYGDIRNIYEVEIVLVQEGQNRVVHAGFFGICWYYGCAYDDYLDLLYTKDRRRSDTTIEPSNCVKRPIGFLEIAKRRYFLDNHRREHVLGPRRVQLPFAEFTN